MCEQLFEGAGDTALSQASMALALLFLASQMADA